MKIMLVKTIKKCPNSLDYSEIRKMLWKAKNDSTALIVYAPVEFGDIPQKRMRQIGERRNVTVTNFRGRLLNDIVVSMITTSYD